MRHWKLSDCWTTPWKNGGGITTELLIYPPDATLDNFAWRISLAQVASNDPFSQFPGVDRSLAILRGAGVCLRSPGQADQVLTVDSAPLCFHGEQEIVVELIEGAVTDLNVMTRRTQWQHRMLRLPALSSYISQGRHLSLLYCDQGQALAGRG